MTQMKFSSTKTEQSEVKFQRFLCSSTRQHQPAPAHINTSSPSVHSFIHPFNQSLPNRGS
ncbi:predicted protein [Sclerotinia sclerotiorum 1980 UF-70]|uniref:Uncharacterized protein n=1 Tax=Sclerotinia sclerotiorum (strain ATCC 18683 / 1980 / Ss-1) TaxID=665079 RepID=A7EDZ0_SCLS1|nr:predicted protein [Sclerotinia sclerotiorum 1980 UF-70]EDO01056.1 predicted protein [Sclerotinia sclerotiorum 1980 UF-70]